MNIDPIYRHLVKPALFCLDPEEAHDLTHELIKSLPLALSVVDAPPQDEKLSTNLLGTVLRNPIGLAAGFDKNGELTQWLGALGFGFAEIGSITAQALPGNAKPRLFRLPQDEAIINRMGLNGHGATAVCARLRNSGISLPIGLSIAKSNDPSITGDLAVSDMVTSFKQALDLPVIYIAINVSCPNTKEGVISESTMLKNLLTVVMQENKTKVPIVLKLSPDSTDEFLDEVVDLSKNLGVAGFICGNTSGSRDGLKTPAELVTKFGQGGLSGKPLKARALKLCRMVACRKSASQIVIGCGGISSGQDAYDFLAAGASCVQLYTAMIYQGPAVAVRIARELLSLLKASAQVR